MEMFLLWTANGKRNYAFYTNLLLAEEYKTMLEDGRYAWTHPASDFAFEPLQPCLEHFERLVHRHDLTFAFSDDPRAWRLGQDSYNRITAMAKLLPQEEVARIWNAWVDGMGWSDTTEAKRWYWRG